MKKRWVCLMVLTCVLPILGLFCSTSAKALSKEGWLWPIPEHKKMSRGYYSNDDATHTAIDINAAYDTPVRATKDGFVIRIYTGCTGNYNSYASCTRTTCAPVVYENFSADSSTGYRTYDGGIYGFEEKDKQGNIIHSWSRCNDGYGIGLLIYHPEDDSISSYAHFSRLNPDLDLLEKIKTGTAKVNQGDIIGYVGASGNAFGAHLHFQIGYSYGNWINNNPNSPSLGITSNNKTGLTTSSDGYSYNTNGVSYIFETQVSFNVNGEQIFPTNLGDYFYAYIRHQNKNVYLTQESNAIYGRNFTGSSEQIWGFYRQSNGAYAIVNAKNNGCIDVLAASTEGGATVYTYTGGYEGLSNQEFYIYYMYGAYYFSPVHSKGRNMLDMNETTYKLELWGVGEDWSPQEFDIFMIPTVNEQFPVNVGSDFHACIRHIKTGYYLTNQLSNIAGEPFSGNDTQAWFFRRMPNGSYVIENAHDGSCIDVLAASTTGGGNVYAYSGGYENLANQRFYIYRMFGGYYFCPEHSNGNNMLDMSESTYNLEIWGVSAVEWTPQQFMIDTDVYTISYDANGGTGAPPTKIKRFQQDISISEEIPERENYRFLGWSTDANASQADYFPGNHYSDDQNLTLYAVWLLQSKYQLMFDTRAPWNGGLVPDRIIGENAEQGERVVIHAIEEGYESYYEGLVFDHWESNNGGVFDDPYEADTVFTMPDGDVTVCAVFRGEASYTLTVTATQGGYVSVIKSANNELLATVSDGTIVLTIAPETGLIIEAVANDRYGFSKWNCTDNHMSSSFSNFMCNMSYRNTTIEAVFKINPYAMEDNKTLHLPAGLQVIESEAFTDVGAVYFDVPLSVRSIGTNAFPHGAVVYIDTRWIEDLSGNVISESGVFIEKSNEYNYEFAASLENTGYHYYNACGEVPE